jgi:hypothetical protein
MLLTMRGINPTMLCSNQTQQHCCPPETVMWQHICNCWIVTSDAGCGDAFQIPIAASEYMVATGCISLQL